MLGDLMLYRLNFTTIAFEQRIPNNTTIFKNRSNNNNNNDDNDRHTHTRPINGPLSVTTQESRYQKGKTNLDFTETRDSEWQWHQLGHMQACTSLQTDDHTSTPPLGFRPDPYLPPNQQHQSTEGIGLTNVQKALESKPGSRDWEHFEN